MIRSSLSWWKKVTKEGEPYQLPLVFKSRDLHWIEIYNREQAIIKLQDLKKGFLKDQNFFKDFCKFMVDFFQTRYAKRLPNGGEDKCCYIQHHGLHNQAKPGKIRVFRIFGEIKVFRIFGICLEPTADTRN